MENSKGIIDTYTTIYFVDIVVANKYVTLEDLQESYTYSDETELDDKITSCVCTTTCGIRKSDNKSVVIVKYNHDTKIASIDKKQDLINTISHEAGHVVMDIYDHMQQNICTCSQEPFCYLLGYVTECIYTTLTKK